MGLFIFTCGSIKIKWCTVNMYTFKSTVCSGTRITKIRPVVIDGEPMMVTMDYLEDRINVEIREGKVVKISHASWVASCNATSQSHLRIFMTKRNKKGDDEFYF